MRNLLRSSRSAWGSALFLGLAATVWAIALFLGLTVAALCVRGENAPSMAAHTLAVAGLVVGVDPENGGLGAPSPEAMERLTAPTSLRPADRPVPVYHADGMVSLDVRSWMREYSVARVGPDGRLVEGCVSGETEAAQVSAAHAPQGLEER
jgi:hypothetical protein